MSRIGKAPISIPAKVTLEVLKGNVVKAKGPHGELFQSIDPDFSVKIDAGTAVIERPTEQKRHKALHGTYRSLVNNMVTGVGLGFTKVLELVGVGYRATVTGSVLELALGYSHPVVILLPSEIKASAEQLKGQNPKITLVSADKELLGLVCAKIRAQRKPEPYKGKGIKFENEVLRRKAGKSASKK
jgi:large subunit ribosomal protein L6